MEPKHKEYSHEMYCTSSINLFVAYVICLASSCCIHISSPCVCGKQILIGIFPFNSLCWVMIGTEEIIHDNVFMVLDFNNCFQVSQFRYCLLSFKMETVILNMMTHKSQYRMEDKFYSDVQLLR